LSRSVLFLILLPQFKAGLVRARILKRGVDARVAECRLLQRIIEAGARDA
jgi:hypothetical protein